MIGILPPAENFIHVIMVHIIDVLNGQRPAKHLQTWMTPQAYQALIRRTRLGMAIHGGAAKCAAPRIRKIRVFHPTPNIAEAGVVLFDGRRIRGAAIRLETRKNRWHIAEIEVI
ncbi:Rv3235 family protein [Arcanobacterium hippocoleae]